jgi:HD-like signal output (HDOD) protein
MKRSIYVVDDQRELLEITVMALRRLGFDWEVTGFGDPIAALGAVKTAKPDAVLTDQMMPVMEGSQLLEEVRIISPATIRLIMSGYVALDRLSSITSAHQYIAKPFDLNKVRDLIQRSFVAQERIANQGLQVVTSLRAIPSLRQTHHSLLEELKNSDAAGTRIAFLISQDPGLSIKVLQLANSGLFGPGGLITDLVEAVNCLGSEMIAAVVLSQSMFRHYESLRHQDIDLARVWAHCWETAGLAQRLCREKRLPHKTCEEAFLAGLLHEVGRFVILDNFPNHFQRACDCSRQTHASLAASLREVLQVTPAQMSAYVLELWGLPSIVINSISLMDTPEQDAASGFSMTSALYIADHLASKTHAPDSFDLENWNAAYLQSIGCEGDIAVWEERCTQTENLACG